MKPGTLVTLNQSLCRPLQPDPAYTLRPPAPLLCARTVAAPHPGPVTPALRVETARGHATGRRIRNTLRTVIVRTGLLATIVGVNLAVLGFERIERARERRLLGRAIAERERHAQRLVEANRHIVGVIRVQHAMLQKQTTEPTHVLARATTVRRAPDAGI